MLSSPVLQQLTESFDFYCDTVTWEMTEFNSSSALIWFLFRSLNKAWGRVSTDREDPSHGDAGVSNRKSRGRFIPPIRWSNSDHSTFSVWRLDLRKQSSCFHFSVTLKAAKPGKTVWNNLESKFTLNVLTVTEEHAKVLRTPCLQEPALDVRGTRWPACFLKWVILLCSTLFFIYTCIESLTGDGLWRQSDCSLVFYQ